MKPGARGTAALLLLLAFCAAPAAAAPWWEVHFTEQMSNSNSAYEQAIYDFIKQANVSVWVTSYTWGNSSHNKLAIALNELYAQGLDVRLVGDNTSAFNTYMSDGYRLAGRTDALASDPDNLMHNKFIVLDYNTANAKVMTGSTNWTDPAYATQNNDIVAINDNAVANCYGREFLELWGGSYRSGPVDAHEYTVSNHSVQLYFAPEDDPGQTYLINLLRNAQHSIYFLSFNHTNGDLATAGTALQARGGIVEGLYETMWSASRSAYLAAGCDVRQDANTDHLHHKLFIVDLETVATGSLNHSQSSSNSTDENEIFIHDFRLAREYMKQFHFCMDQTTTALATATHEDNAPAVVTNLGAVDTPNDFGRSLTVSWTASTAADVAGYYVYISRNPIASVQNLVPEKFVRGATSTAITTYNQDDPISNNTDYYIAVSAVDEHGNENYNCPTTGPVQASGIITGARPSGTISFDTASSRITTQSGTLVAVVRNDTGAASAIHAVTIIFGNATGGTVFRPLAQGLQTAPAGWTVSALTDTSITFTAQSAASDIAVTQSETFTIAVTNPSTSGTSNAVTMDVVAANAEVVAGTALSGSLVLTAPVAVPNFSLAWGAGASQRGGDSSIIVATMGNAAGASSSLSAVQFTCGTGIASFIPRGSNVQAPPTGWTVSGAGDVLTYTATDTAYFVDPGESLAFNLAVTNPGINRSSTALTATSTDQYGLTVPNVSLGTLRVLATDGVVFNEIMYNPVGTDALFEFVELYNRTAVTVELGGWRVNCGGVVTTLSDTTTLNAYSFLVIASTRERGTAGDAFFESYSTRYGNGDGLWIPDPATPGEDYEVIDGTDFNLNDDADYLTLTSSDSSFAVTVRYNDAISLWQGADGTGASLEKRDPFIGDVGQADVDGLNWGSERMTTTYPYGTTGTTNSIAVTQVPPITGFSVRSASMTSVTLGWTALSGYTTFGGYVLYYATVSPVTGVATVWNSANDPNLATMSTTTTTITGLTANTTYYFRMVAQSTISGLGNLDAASEVSALTQSAGGVTVNYLHDGVRYVTDYEGNSVLRDVGVTVNLRLQTAPVDSTSVMVWYDVGADPDGSGTGNTSDRFARAAGNGTTWDVIIPGMDPEIVDGARVRFMVMADGRNFFYNGLPWQYLVDGGISASFTDLAAVGVGEGRVELRWTPVTNIPDFSQYRIYYTGGTDTITNSSAHWDASDDYILAYATTNSTVLTGLGSGSPYRFRIVAVDRYGNESELGSSNEPAGTALTGTVIITEFAPEGDTLSAAVPWAELYCVSGSQNMATWNLTDRDGNTVPVGAVTMTAGQYRVVYFGDSTMFTGDDQLALDVDNDTANGSYADALVWMDADALYGADALADVRALGPGNWQYAASFTGAAGVAKAFSVPYIAGGFASLVRATIDGYRDENNHYDWRLQFAPSKGVTNGITTVSLLGFSDGTNSGFPDGYAYYQDTAATVRFGFGTAPADTTTVRVCYNLDSIPTGDPAGSDSWVTMVPQGDFLTWGCTIPGTGNPVANSGRRRNFIVVADGIPYYRDNVQGVTWSYRFDGTRPDTVNGFRVQGVTAAAAIATWTPSVSISDFYSYRVYYAAAPGPVTTASAYVDRGSVPELQHYSTAGATVNGLTAGQSYVLAVAVADDRGNVAPLSAMDTADILPSLAVSSLTVSDTAGNSVNSGFTGSDRLRGTTLSVSLRFNEAPAATPQLWYDGRMAPDGPGGANAGDRTVAMTMVGDSFAWTATIPYTDTSVVNDTTLQLVFSASATVVRNGSVPFKIYIDTTAAPLTAPAGFRIIGTMAGGVTLAWSPPGVTTGFSSYRVFYADTTVMPATLTATSAYVDKAQYATLGTASTGGVTLTGLNAGCTYVFAVAAADAIGNVTALSNTDTGLTLVSQYVVALTLTDTAGNSITSVFDGNQKLRDADVAVAVTLAEAAAGTPVLWYDAGGVPDGPGGANLADRPATMTQQGDARQWAGVIPATDSEIVHDTTVQIVVYTSGAALQFGGRPWKYTVDEQSGGAPVLMSTNPDANSTTVILSWSTVAPADFGSYRAYYAKAGTVTKADSAWTTAKDGNLASALTAGTSIRGLVASDTYTFAVAWRDAYGNESPLSNALSRLTNAMTPAADPASDGFNIAHRLDGTESLRDTDITVTMLLAAPPTAAGSACLYYDVGGFPDGPGPGNSEERRVQLVDSPDNDPYTWTAVIPGGDPELADGALVRYVGAADGFILTNGGTPYAFRIDSSAPPAAGNPVTIDNGSMITVAWTPVSAPDFAGYRIYYNTAWPARAGLRRDWAVDASLGAAVTSGTTLSGLDPAQNYYLNIATVDAVGNERLLASDLILYRRAPGAATAVALVQGSANGSGEVYAGAAWPLAVRLTDATGLPTPGENVTFTVTAGAGLLAGGAAQTVATGLDGVARVTLATGADPAVVTQVRAAAGALTPVVINVQTTLRAPAALRLLYPATATTDETITLAVEALTADGSLDTAWSGGMTLNIAEHGLTPGTLRGAGAITLANGRGTWLLGNREAEAVDLQARSATLTPVQAMAAVSFTAGAAAQLRLTVPAATVAGSAAPVTVAVLDAGGNACLADSATSVQLTVDGSAYASLGGAQRVAGGFLAATVTDLTVETVTVRATSAGLPAAAALLAVTPAPAVKASATTWVNAAAGGVAPVTVEIRDAYGNRVSGDNGRTVTLGVTGTAQVLTANPTVNGVAAFTVTDAFAGDVTLTPAAATLASMPGLAHFYSGADTLSAAVALQSAVAAPLATAGAPLTVNIRVLDGRGQPDLADNGRTVTLTAAGSAQPAAATAVTVAGVASFTISDTRAEQAVLTATAAGLRPCTLTVTVQAGAPARVAATAPAAVGGGQPATVAVTLTDAYGNTINDNVSLAGLLPDRGTVGNAGALTGGARALTVTTPVAGPLAVVPVVGGLRGETLAITVNSGAAYQISALVAATAAPGATVALVLEVQDAGGNRVISDNGRRVALLLDGNAASPAQSGAPTTTAGRLETTLTAAGAGTVMVYPQALGLICNTGTIIFATQPAAVVAVAGAATATVDDTVTVRVEVRDAGGNLITADAATGVSLVVPAGVRVAEAQPVTVTGGVAVFHVGTDVPGIVTLTPVAGALGATPATIDFRTGAPARVAATAPAAVAANQPATVTVTLTDAHGNVIDDNVSMATLAVGRGTVGNAGALSGGARALTVTTPLAGSLAVVPVAGGWRGETLTITVNSGPAAQLVALAAETTATGVAASLVLEVQDAFGNCVTTDNGRVLALGLSGGATSPAQSGSPVTTAGRLVTTLTAAAAGEVVVTPIAVPLASVSDTILFIAPAAAARLVALVAETATAGATVDLVIEVQDALGNCVTTDNGRRVTLLLDGSATSPAQSGAPVTTAGRLVTTLTATLPGTVMVYPMAAGLTTELDTIVFVAPPPPVAAAVVAVAGVAVAPVDDTVTVRLEVRDGGGLVLAADNATPVRLTVPAGVRVAEAQPVTVTGGVAIFHIGTNVPGSVVLTPEAGALAATPATVEFRAGAPARVAATAPATVAANQPATVVVTLTDAYGNIINDNALVVDLAAGRGIVGNAGALAGGSRALTVTTPLAGPLPVVPMAGGLRGETLTIAVNSGPAARIVAQVADTALAGATDNLVIEVRDAFGNCVTTDNGRRVALLFDGNATSPAQSGSPVTTAGRLVTTLTAAAPGAVMVYPMAAGLTSDPDTIAFVAPAPPPAAPVAAAVVATAGAAVAAIDDTMAVRVEVRDGSGALMTADNATPVRLNVPAGVRVAEAQPVTVTGGVAVFHIGTDALGSVTLTPQAGLLAATPATIEFRSGVPARVRVTGPPGAVSGSGAVLTLTVEDRAGNVLDWNWPVALTATGSALVPASVTTVAGRATLTVTDAVAETVTVTPAVAGLAATAHSLIFAPNTPQRLTLTVAAEAVFAAAFPVTIDVVDALNNPVAGAGEVVFAVDRGTVTPATATLAGASLTANLTLTASGTVRLTARWSGLADTRTLALLVPPATAATVQAAADVAVKLPAGLLADSCYVTARTGAAAATGLSLGGVVGEPVELFLMDAVRNDTVTANFATLVTVEVAYADADQNGLVDGTAIAEHTLQLYRWESGAWVVVQDGGRNAADAARNVVVADLKHFSQYAIRVSTDTGAAGGEIIAYPNPWKSTNTSQRIVFANVPTGVPVRLRIFTIGGEKVADNELTLGANQRLEWDLCNEGGEAVASGIYFYIITGGGVEKIGKLAIIR